MNNHTSPNDSSNEIRRLFWTRFSAILIDTYFVFILTYTIVVCARLFHRYIPFELSFIVLVILYPIIMTGWKGQTFGKMLCGLTIKKKDGQPVGFPGAFFREFIGKICIPVIPPALITLILLRSHQKNILLGLLLLFFIIVLPVMYIIQYVISKRAWYDYVTRTIVVFNTGVRNRARLIMGLVFVMSGILIGIKAIQSISIYNVGKKMSPYSYAETVYKDRDPSSLKEISALNPKDDSTYVQWLDIHGESPREYAIKKASQHQVTIFGELHGNRRVVRFLHEIMNDLYHRAGVRCIALEVCNHEDNKAIDRLITAPEYDRELALHIGRNQNRHLWGGKEYWEIFEVVWRLNKSLSVEQPKMRIVGIDTRYDIISFSLVSGGDNSIEAALWEKLRLLRVILSFPQMAFRDELMAKQVEKEIIEKKERGIVWIGESHSFLRYKQLSAGKGRMAYMLHQKYGDKIFQIIFHTKESSIENTDSTSTDPGFCNFIERIMAVRNHEPVGFDTVESPFKVLRDSSIYRYHNKPNTCFGDITSGFIYLEPREKFQGCRWIEGFITSHMLAKYKPFYQSRFGRKFNSAREANDFFRTLFQKN